MLTRILTGFVLAILAIWASFGFSNLWFGVLCGAVILLAAWEWADLYCQHGLSKCLYLIGLCLLAWLGYTFFLPMLAVTFVWWVLTLALLAVPLERLVWLKRTDLMTAIGYLLLVTAWVSAVRLHDLSHLVVFTLIMFVCFADTGAYFIGFKYGKTPLAPRLSPKKTIAGLWGGLLIGAVAGMSMVVLMPDMTWKKAMLWLMLGLFIIMVSIVGDLFESLIKRISDTKDSGSLLPGHGGILDRVDSLCAALPIYALILFYLWPSLVR